MPMFMRDKKIICATVGLIKASIKRNGLEKTLEDIATVGCEDCPANAWLKEGGNERFESVWKGFLVHMEDLKKEEKELQDEGGN